MYKQLITIISLMAIVHAAASATDSGNQGVRDQDAPVSSAQQPIRIEIKGFFIGMTHPEMMAHANSFHFGMKGPEHDLGYKLSTNKKPYFTIGGIGLEIGSLNIDDMEFVFDPSGFQEIQSAFLTKYPNTHCVDSDVTNRLGNHFTQTVCSLETSNDKVILARYAGDVTQGLVKLISAEHNNADRTSVLRQRSDL